MGDCTHSDVEHYRLNRVSALNSVSCVAFTLHRSKKKWMTGWRLYRYMEICFLWCFWHSRPPSYSGTADMFSVLTGLTRLTCTLTTMLNKARQPVSTWDGADQNNLREGKKYALENSKSLMLYLHILCSTVEYVLLEDFMTIVKHCKNLNKNWNSGI